MANVDRPFGFLPAGSLNGGAEVVRMCTKDASDGTLIGIGDLVDIDGTADGVARAAAGGPFLGASLAFGAASTLTTHPVAIANDSSVYVAQEDSVGGAIAAASEGFNADVIVANANTTTGISQMEIDSNTAATTNTLDVRLLQPAPYPDNTVAVANARWLVLINDLRFTDQKAGV